MKTLLVALTLAVAATSLTLPFPADAKTWHLGPVESPASSPPWMLLCGVGIPWHGLDLLDLGATVAIYDPNWD